MADTRQQLADHRAAVEPDLELLLHARDDEEIDRLMERVQCWRRELLVISEAHDPVSLHFTNVRPELQEVARIVRFYPELRGDQQGLCNYVEAVLARLNKYLLQPGTRPKRPGRKKGQKLFDDTAAIEKAREQLALPNPPTMRKAAIAVEPLADQEGASPEANIAAYAQTN